MTPSRPVKDCTVWLVKILDPTVEGAFQENFRFAVPRLMQWAPAEYSPEARSFSEDQVFDFGKTYVNLGYFNVDVYRQGGVFNGRCNLGHTRRYIFRLTANNYIKARTVAVDVAVEQVQATEEWPYTCRATVHVRG